MKLLRVACVAAIFPAACDGGMSPVSDPEPDDTPVRVGFLVSGDRTYANGAAIAVDEVNGRGGLLGRTVQLVVRAGLEEAAQAVEAAEAMIGSDRVAALIGPNRSSHAIEVGAVAQRLGVPMITTAATNPGVTAAGDLVFMAAFTDQFQGRVMAEFAAGTLGVTSSAVLTERGNVYSEGIGEFFIDHFRESGGAIVAEESYERGATDFAGQLARVADATPGAVFVPVRAEDVVLLAAQARALPVHDDAGEPALFLGADAWDNPALLENGGAAVDGSFFSSHFSPDTNEPTARAFVDTYRAPVRYAAHGRRRGELRCGPAVSGGCGTGGQPRRRRRAAGGAGHPAVRRSHTHLPLQRRSPPDQECGHHDHRERREAIPPAGGSVADPDEREGWRGLAGGPTVPAPMSAVSTTRPNPASTCRCSRS